MAYVQIEADEVRVDPPNVPPRSNLRPQRLEEGPESLQFHCMRYWSPRALVRRSRRCSLPGFRGQSEPIEGRERPRCGDVNVSTSGADAV